MALKRKAEQVARLKLKRGDTAEDGNRGNGNGQGKGKGKGKGQGKGKGKGKGIAGGDSEQQARAVELRRRMTKPWEVGRMGSDKQVLQSYSLILHPFALGIVVLRQ